MQFAELLSIQEVAELLEEIHRQNIDIVDGTDELLLELLYLLPNLIFFLCRILIHKEIVEEVSVLGVLKLTTGQFFV